MSDLGLGELNRVCRLFSTIVVLRLIVLLGLILGLELVRRAVGPGSVDFVMVFCSPRWNRSVHRKRTSKTCKGKPTPVTVPIMFYTIVNVLDTEPGFLL